MMCGGGPGVALTLCSFVFNSTKRFVLSITLRFVLVFFSSLGSACLGNRELVCVLFVRLFVLLFVYFVGLCLFSLPLGVRDRLRFLIVALPGFLFLTFSR